jgi:hypothetical protein
MRRSLFPASCISLFCVSTSAVAVSTPLLKSRDEGCNCSCTSAGQARDSFLRQILTSSPEYGNFEVVPSTGPVTVGIVGAGAAGLYAAMILESLGIDYEILESSQRIGGRIFTYRFDEEA